MLETPVLFLIFNRPDTTQKVFEKIREAKPKQLFIAADGPRAHVLEDDEKCRQTREVATQVDWDCEVKTLFRGENLGCGQSVSQAITWFFDQVEQGIILEDDCLPSASFFSFMSDLLDYFKEDNEVKHISGGNYLPEKYFDDASYYFSKYMYSWGWATWARAWKDFNYEIDRVTFLSKYNFSSDEKEYWLKIFHKIENLDTWAFRWNFCAWRSGGKSVVSVKNRVKNIGFGEQSTHTKVKNRNYDKINFYEDSSYSLIHPSTANINQWADYQIFLKYNLGKNNNNNFIKRVYGRLQSILLGKERGY